jgi:type III restriction enzyme
VSFQLLPFQTQAADQIAARYLLLATDRRRPMEWASWPTPYYQALAALTGSGKTPILADAVAQIRALMEREPIVLWISKSKAVVDQTTANFEPGGKYESLIEGFVVTTLAQTNGDLIGDDAQPLLVLATVGSFNQKAKGEGTLKVHQKAEDTGDAALWEMLTSRTAPGAAAKRPLIIVYDEAHNLADQQTDLLLELEPDVILVASATMRTPSRLGQIITRLQQSGWTDEIVQDEPDGPQRGLVTAVRSGDVVEAGLVKRQVVLGGYSTEMETALADMLAEFAQAGARAHELDAGFRPKAIYVCRTNITLDDGTTDLPSRPFEQRRARPILIWRYLVEVAKVDPAEIAVYCDLRVDRKGYPPPPDFRLFSGGEDDFAAFTAGDFRHIIFNQSLQEGWDDPECGFAYIDKSMGSAVQVEQVIGRVLRQPGARHYSDPDLNSANFYIRVDDRQEFQRTLNAVRDKLGSEMPEVRLEGFADGRDRKRGRLEPREVIVVPEIHIDADAAVEPMDQVLATLPDYTSDTVNVRGPGEQMRAVQAIGDGSEAKVVTRARDHSNRVVARWLIRRAMQRLYPEAVKTVDWADPRFDARVEVTSPAAHQLREQGEKLVDVFLEHAELAFETTNPYAVGAVLTRPDQLHRFSNSIHDGYSDLNAVELEFAQAIDQLGLKWARNPSNGGYSIPLLEKGGSRRFFPDFLVWNGGVAYALDPKGKHLIMEDAGRKLLAIRDERGNEFVQVRLITEGRWQADPIKQTSPGGYSVWRLSRASKVRCTHHVTVESALRKAVELPALAPTS